MRAWALPLRLKIVILIAASLTVSLLAYVFIGTRLTIDDKTAYIYDYNLARIEALSQSLEGQFAQLLWLERYVGSIASPRLGEADLKAIEGAYRDSQTSVGLEGMVLLREREVGTLTAELRLGKRGDALYTALSPLVLKPQDFPSSGLRARAHPGNEILLLSQLPDKTHAKLYLMAWLKPPFPHLEASQSRYLTLLSETGDELSYVSTLPQEPEGQEFETLFGDLAAQKFGTGARDWSAGGNRLIVGYRRLSQPPLTIVGMIPADEAFSAARALMIRSLALGLSVLLLSIGGTLLFVKRVTQTLKQMWLATQKVSQGDFSARVDATNLGRDEVRDLAVSFNSMADRIDELMVQTARKATLEKEIETAQAVQSNFFPPKLEAPEMGSTRLFDLAGRSLAATQCGGDWWYYAQLGDHLITVVGDVTGHGVSAALLTASAHGAFSTFVRLYQSKTKNRAPSLSLLAEYLNTAIWEGAKGQSTMTCIASILNLSTGELEYANFSHKPIYIVHADGKTGANGTRRDVLVEPILPALGSGPQLAMRSERAQMQAGDLLFFYTDGLVECKSPEGVTLRPLRLIRHLEGAQGEASQGAQAACDSLVEMATTFLGENSKALTDDITVVVLSLSSLAPWAEADKNLTTQAAA